VDIENFIFFSTIHSTFPIDTIFEVGKELLVVIDANQERHDEIIVLTTYFA